MRPSQELDGLLRAAFAGPRPPRLPAMLLYDDLGSALFEAITRLPEYGVTRADHGLLRAHAAAVGEHVPGPVDVIELGPGYGLKARTVLAAGFAQRPGVVFTGIDVSAASLEATRATLRTLAGVEFAGIQAPYLEGLARAPRRPAYRRIVLFLGSNLSNIDPAEVPEFLGAARACLAPGDALLLSADLDKPVPVLLKAYDDPLGVTAAFNRNVLVRLNREFGANFGLSSFHHEARWDGEHRRIEMHLRCTRACVVNIGRLNLTVEFALGDTLWTESSHRFTVPQLEHWARQCGFEPRATWVDAEWPFALSLWIATPGVSK